MTVSEITLWQAIRGKATGARFRRQVPIGEYIADFASFSPRLIVELDGDDHYWKDEAPRTQYMERQGFTVLRYDNKDIAQQRENVVAHICASVGALRAGRDLPEW